MRWQCEGVGWGGGGRAKSGGSVQCLVADGGGADVCLMATTHGCDAAANRPSVCRWLTITCLHCLLQSPTVRPRPPLAPRSAHPWNSPSPSAATTTISTTSGGGAAWPCRGPVPAAAWRCALAQPQQMVGQVPQAARAAAMLVVIMGSPNNLQAGLQPGLAFCRHRLLVSLSGLQARPAARPAPLLCTASLSGPPRRAAPCSRRLRLPWGPPLSS